MCHFLASHSSRFFFPPILLSFLPFSFSSLIVWHHVISFCFHRCENFLTPHLEHRLVFSFTENGTSDYVETCYGDNYSTYSHQLQNFVKAVAISKSRRSTANNFAYIDSADIPDAENGVKAMQLVDSIYIEAGFGPRNPTPTLHT